MCVCKQKSKKPAGTPGNFNYVFTCTKDNGTAKEIKVTAGNDNEAKQLAELDCDESKIESSIRKIITEDFDDSIKVLLNTDYSNEQLLIVSFWGTNNWFNIPTNTIEEISKIGYGVFEGKQFPLVSINIKKSHANFSKTLTVLKWNLSRGEIGELPSFREVVESTRSNLLARELSGAQWVNRYPTSTSISDLTSPFRENIQSFYNALGDAGATVSISATLRPTERAYLMRTSYDIANSIIKPSDAPTLASVNIEWVHSTLQESISAASAMVSGYGIVYQPAYPTKHSDGTAIDMNTTWAGTLNLKKADGTTKSITSTPRTNANSDLQKVANTYSVYKLASDPPHWSDNGH